MDCPPAKLLSNVDFRIADVHITTWVTANQFVSEGRCILITILGALVIFVLAAVVPMAVLLPRKQKRSGRSSSGILIPLYIYPLNDTSWQPLYDAIEAHQQLNFTIVINPDSGPGSTPFPDENYSVQIPRLNSYPNVKTVDYVATGYAANNMTTVIDQIAVYSGWSSRSESLAMHGIFCDESPYLYSEDAAEYMRTLNLAIKSTEGLRGDRMTIHNPGVVPDVIFNDPNTDVTVVFEESYEVWEVRQNQITENSMSQALMVYSVPRMMQHELQTYVDGLTSKAQYLFLTNNEELYYESWGSNWANFTQAVANTD